MGYKIGTKQATKTVESGQALRVYIARDADGRLTDRMAELCKREGVPIIWVNTMIDLGKQCGIDIGAAMAALAADDK